MKNDKETTQKYSDKAISLMEEHAALFPDNGKDLVTPVLFEKPTTYTYRGPTYMTNNSGHEGKPHA